MPTDAMMYSPSEMSYREAVARGIPAERWEKKWRGYVTGDHSGQWPRVHSQWFPPAWAMEPEHIQLEPLPYRWALTIDLMPTGTRTKRVQSQLPEEAWEQMREAAFRRAGHQCEICGAARAGRPVKTHEVWSYDDLWKTQRFERIQALCLSCHQVKHIDETCTAGNVEEATRHLASVNDWPAMQAKLYVNQRLLHWKARSRFEWTVDLGPLKSDAFQQWLRSARRSENASSENGPLDEKSRQQRVGETDSAGNRESATLGHARGDSLHAASDEAFPQTEAAEKPPEAQEEPAARAQPAAVAPSSPGTSFGSPCSSRC